MKCRKSPADPAEIFFAEAAEPQNFAEIISAEAAIFLIHLTESTELHVTLRGTKTLKNFCFNI